MEYEAEVFAHAFILIMAVVSAVWVIPDMKRPHELTKRFIASIGFLFAMSIVAGIQLAWLVNESV